MPESHNSEFIKNIAGYLPAISVDVVIFGFHENELKILLLESKDQENWALPGGFVRKEEFLEEAPKRVLKERTGLSGIFLEQFHVFGDPERTRANNRAVQLTRQLENDDLSAEIQDWLLSRFITIGYYALVEFTQVDPQADFSSIRCSWFDINELPPLISDHKLIVEQALKTVRLHLNFQPIGMNLLPSTFTMPELQRLYETILGTTLDRRNFQRRMMSYDILTRLDEKRTGGAFKAPFLYKFNETRYQQALLNGLKDVW